MKKLHTSKCGYYLLPFAVGPVMNFGHTTLGLSWLAALFCVLALIFVPLVVDSIFIWRRAAAERQAMEEGFAEEDAKLLQASALEARH